MPIALDVIEAVAVKNGVCIRPLTMHVTDRDTSQVAYVDIPCGATLETKCPTCAERARRLRVHQCREGWHLDTDPDLTPDHPTEDQMGLVIARPHSGAARDRALAAGDDGEVAAQTAAAFASDADLRRAGVRGDIDPPAATRATRSTRRRDDAPDLPKKAMADTTVGRTFEGHKGEVFRPSMFLTVTLGSYGRVNPDGTPRHPDSYDYVRAARDAIGFSALLDRLVQNLRRVAGYDVQYFATVEPQRRLAPHAHFAIRGTIPRAVVRQVVAATYKQVWWPTPGQPVYDDQQTPIWDQATELYVDADTGVPLTTWDEAMGQLDQADDLAHDLAQLGYEGGGAEPFHVLRFGAQVDLQGLLAGTPEADRRIGYLAKYLTKSMTDAHDIDPTDPNAARQKAHVDRLERVLRLEPCKPGCSNWLRYGITPRGAHAHMAPGSCRSKAHKREHLGYAGRRILVSRKWSGKTLADHRADRRAWVLATLGIANDQDQADDQGNPTAGRSGPPRDKTRDRYTWQPAGTNAPIAPLPHRLLIAINQRQHWRAAYEAARDGKPPPTANLSATHPAAHNDSEVA